LPCGCPRDGKCVCRRTFGDGTEVAQVRDHTFTQRKYTCTKYSHAGHWDWWRENGNPLQAGAFKGGVQAGIWKRYYDSGQLRDEGRYEQGKKIGEWKTFAKGGSLKQSNVFKPKK
jgi:antitoxin component YwqK of YwqJK toxin-antitoxin module